MIIDKSSAFISFQKERVLENWGAGPTTIKKVDRVLEAGSVSLFGDCMVSILNLESPEEIKSCVEDFEKLKNSKTVEAKLSQGLLIETSVARTSTKKLEKIIADLQGEVIIATPARGDKTSTSARLLSELNLNQQAREFFLTYVGDDYEAVIPLVKTLSKLTVEQQATVTEEDIFLRLPQAKGAVAPWVLEGPIFAGNINETIDVYRRVAQNSHLLVVLKVLNNKFQLIYRVTSIMQGNPKVTKDILAKQLGVPNNYPLQLAMGYSKKYGYAKIEAATGILAMTEANVKGGSGADPHVLMELMLVRLISIFEA